MKLARARRSMTAQISLAIAIVAVLAILFFGNLSDRVLAHELREENELVLLSNLAFLRDDLAAAGGDAAAIPALVQRTLRRTRRLELAVREEGGRAIVHSPGPELPKAGPGVRLLDAAVLPADASMGQLEALRLQLGDAASFLWSAPNGTRYRVLEGRIAAGLARPVLVSLAIETTPTRELRERNRQGVMIAMLTAAALATLLGIWIARHILVNLRRFGATASRVGVRDLHERLPLEGTPTELLESAVAFNHMMDRLQAAFERLSAFSSDLAHDLRTPISNLLGEAQVALSRPRSAEEYRAVLESAVEEYERLSRMIANMLFLARADNQPGVTASWTDLQAALERLVGYFELLAEERGVGLQMEVHAATGGPARVWADETMLVRAVSNLVSNALQHAARGSVIRMVAETVTDGSCVLTVSNDGPPIPPEHLDRIFERFFRVDASRQGSAAGSGLGLAIVRSIMEMHGGSVAVSSAPGRPTAFTLRFPGEPAAVGLRDGMTKP
ncbi:heavy metal sensor histidine kinase [Ramlibacter sp. G-1-2-2]|uniref:Sensor protein n=1 Tax=Ramlibacter agri TaxID=2728837 RepID=A0A848H7F8_9BURK|nr:heavy metal sensor histidine kinase [Ramlibacter agri]NML46725.1 heavy metal sensor histidine kinase [Ramlibacter agri]